MSKTPAIGDNGGGNAGYFSAVPTLNYVHSVSPDLKLGLGVGSYFGLGLNYSNEWAGKYYVQNASITTLAFNPTIGYKIADWLSIGGGVSVVQGNLSERVAVNTLSGARGRPAQVRCLGRGLRLQPRRALRVEPPDPRGRHLRLPGRPGFQGRLALQEPRRHDIGGRPEGLRAAGFPAENRHDHPGPAVRRGLSRPDRQAGPGRARSTGRTGANSASPRLRSPTATRSRPTWTTRTPITPG